MAENVGDSSARPDLGLEGERAAVRRILDQRGEVVDGLEDPQCDRRHTGRCGLADLGERRGHEPVEAPGSFDHPDGTPVTIPFIATIPPLQLTVGERYQWRVSIADEMHEDWLAGSDGVAEVLDAGEVAAELVIAGLRRVGGVDLAEVGRRTGVIDRWTATVAEMEAAGLLSVHGDRIAVTPAGMVHLDAVSARFV